MVSALVVRREVPRGATAWSRSSPPISPAAPRCPRVHAPKPVPHAPVLRGGPKSLSAAETFAVDASPAHPRPSVALGRRAGGHRYSSFALDATGIKLLARLMPMMAARSSRSRPRAPRTRDRRGVTDTKRCFLEKFDRNGARSTGVTCVTDDPTKAPRRNSTDRRACRSPQRPCEGSSPHRQRSGDGPHMRACQLRNHRRLVDARPQDESSDDAQRDRSHRL